MNPDPPREVPKLDCSGCTECCKWMTFILLPPEDVFQKYYDFYIHRGCKLQAFPTAQGKQLAVTVPSTCQYLTSDGCSLEKSSKPELCREYDCRTDPFLNGGKYKS